MLLKRTSIGVLRYFGRPRTGGGLDLFTEVVQSYWIEWKYKKNMVDIVCRVNIIPADAQAFYECKARSHSTRDEHEARALEIERV